MNKREPNEWDSHEESHVLDDIRRLLSSPTKRGPIPPEYLFTMDTPMNKHAISSTLLAAAALGVLAAADGHERSYGAPRPSIGAVRKGVARRRAKQSQKKARRRNRK